MTAHMTQLQYRCRTAIATLLCSLGLIVAGCTSSPLPPSMPPVADATESKRASTVPSAPAIRNVPVLPPAGSGRGGYYQDDGPGDAPPGGLLEIPDAEPKVEPYTRRGNRPYVVFNKSYTPFTDDRPFKQRGIGSWYGKKFHGQMTSSGEIYDMYKMTAAHPTLPLPSYVRVKNVRNGKQVIVRVNDRGPFHAGRIIDLSYTAALKLDYLKAGSAELEVERLLPDDIARINSEKQSRTAPEHAVPPASSAQLEAIAQPVVYREANQSPSMIPSDSVAAEKRIGNPTGRQDAAVPSAATSAAAGFYLQLGAYGNSANAEAARSRLAQAWVGALPPPEVVQGGGLHRIQSGPFATRDDAETAARQIQEKVAVNPAIVRR